MAQREPMSLFQFHQLFSTEEDCTQHAFDLRWPKGFICPRCQNDKYGLIKSRLLYRCKSCRYQASLTAGSIMHRTRTPLMVWFWTIFLVGCDKRGHSALSLSKEMGISYWVAWTMLQKIRKAMGQQDANYRLDGLVEMDEGYFGGTSKTGKRGRGTTKSKVLIAVSTDVDKKHAKFLKMKRVEDFNRSTVEKFVNQHLTDGCTVQTDGLNIYESLSSLVKEHQKLTIKTGASPLPWVHTIIANAKSFVGGTFHGLAPKHLQAYLDEFCYRFNRRFWEGQLFNRLLAACLGYPPTTYGELTK